MGNIILGTDWLFENQIIVGLPRGRLWRLEALPLRSWQTDVRAIIRKGKENSIAAHTAAPADGRHAEFPPVWTQKRPDCGKINACVKMMGAVVPPRKEDSYPKEADIQLLEIIHDLGLRGVVRETNSLFHSPVWPGLTAHGRTGRLTVGYRRINRETAQMAPVVANIRQRGQATSKYFSVMDLANRFFAIPSRPDSQDRFAFPLKDQEYTVCRAPGISHCPCHLSPPCSE